LHHIRKIECFFINTKILSIIATKKSIIAFILGNLHENAVLSILLCIKTQKILKIAAFKKFFWTTATFYLISVTLGSLLS